MCGGRLWTTRDCDISEKVGRTERVNFLKLNLLQKIRSTLPLNLHRVYALVDLAAKASKTLWLLEWQLVNCLNLGKECSCSKFPTITPRTTKHRIFQNILDFLLTLGSSTVRVNVNVVVYYPDGTNIGFGGFRIRLSFESR